MGALLVFTGIRLAFAATTRRGLRRAAARCARCGACCRSARSTTAAAIFAREDGHRVATPLLAALLAVALADVIFAIDSIPAVLAITTDTFLIFAANAFALLGLRALYFLLDGMAQRFEYLHYGLGALLVFVGVKMLVEDIVGHLPVGVSLGGDRRHAGRVGRRLAAVLEQARGVRGLGAGPVPGSRMGRPAARGARVLVGQLRRLVHPQHGGLADRPPDRRRRLHRATTAARR